MAPAVAALLAQMVALPHGDRARAQQCFGRLLRRELSTRLAEMQALLEARACLLAVCSASSTSDSSAAHSNLPTPLRAASDLLLAVLHDVHLTMHNWAVDIESSDDSDPMSFIELRASLTACADLLAAPAPAAPATTALRVLPAHLSDGSGVDNDPISDASSEVGNATMSDTSPSSPAPAAGRG